MILRLVSVRPDCRSDRQEDTISTRSFQTQTETNTMENNNVMGRSFFPFVRYRVCKTCGFQAASGLCDHRCTACARGSGFYGAPMCTYGSYAVRSPPPPPSSSSPKRSLFPGMIPHDPPLVTFVSRDVHHPFATDSGQRV